MRLLFKYLLCLLMGILLFSCGKNNSQETLLKQSQESLTVGKPDVALGLLGSIQNPQQMDLDSYMRYIVTYVGAKKETKADISADTLIFKAQHYFIDKRDFKLSALANYYAGWVYYTNNKFPQSLESFMHSTDAADKSTNFLLAAKSFNNIGYIYYQQNLFDSAVYNYNKALSYYDKLENVSQQKIETFTNIGLSYEENKKLDSAYVYYQKALDKSVETNNEKYQSYSLQNLGVLFYNMQDYDKAIMYYQSALNLPATDQEDVRRMNIAMLMIYTKIHDPKSAKQYADLVIASLPEVSYNYTIKEMYAALSDYYQETGDYKQALEYSNMEKVINEQIKQGINVLALLEADKNYYLTQKEREAQAFISRIYLVVIAGTIVVLIVGIFALLTWRNHKKGLAELRAYTEKYEILLGMLLSKCDEYPRIEAEIEAIMKDVDKE